MIRWPILPGLLMLLAGEGVWAEPASDLTSSPQMTLPIWNGPAPSVPANPGEEKTGAKGRVSNVSVPTLDVYLPEPAHANGTAIIICSGGGYTQLASGPLGSAGAKLFLPQGIAVFSLKYRVKPPSTDVKADALADVKRAVRLVRSRAAEWHINPDRIGLVGFSAGGHLILNLCGHGDSGNPQAVDPLDKQSCRPDFIGLGAPWPGGQKIESFNLGSDLPPAYINHARDDATAPYTFSEQIAAAWAKAGRPVKLELYDKGGHMAFNFTDLYVKDWPEKFLAWLREQKLLDEPPAAP